ncbi:MAG TPA: DUF3375 domain-containing protein, partial [Chitinophagaceae bacterium]|nr:DUF3375 domain-containing protein [Chitinophagaceae bacterium]
MNFEKAAYLYKNDKTLQFLRAEQFPLLVSFFHLAFKQLNRIQYKQAELSGLLGDFLYSPELKVQKEYQNDSLEYLRQWSAKGYLRRYYDAGDDPIYELTPATENVLKLLDDLNRQEFVGTQSRLLHLFTLLKEIVNKTNANTVERIEEMESKQRLLGLEIEKAKRGIYEKLDDTHIKELYLFADETSRRLLADFRQVEQNFRELDLQTRQTIVKSSLPKGKLLEDIFGRQDFMWTTDQGKSFKAFWEFLMSRQMQEDLEKMIAHINELPPIREVKKDDTIDRIKTNLVEAGSKVNRTNDSLIEQLRKFVELKSLAESRRIMHSIEQIETILLGLKDNMDFRKPLLEIGNLFKGVLFMERPLFRPPVKIRFDPAIAELGIGESDTRLLFEQFYIDLDQLNSNVNNLLKGKSQVGLTEVLRFYRPTKGMAEVLGYMQIATRSHKHYIQNETQEQIEVENIQSGKMFQVQLPLVIFNR